jgi:hypothetical protein
VWKGDRELGYIFVKVIRRQEIGKKVVWEDKIHEFQTPFNCISLRPVSPLRIQGKVIP